MFFSFYYYRIFKIYKIIQNHWTLLRIKKSTIEIFSRIQKYNFDSFPTSFSFSFLNNRFNWRDRERERNIEDTYRKTKENWSFVTILGSCETALHKPEQENKNIDHNIEIEKRYSIIPINWRNPFRVYKIVRTREKKKKRKETNELSIDKTSKEAQLT